MTHILLTGAGFSRNWGCWLVDEVFEYLLAEPQLTPTMRNQLWRDKNLKRNYEDTIQALRDEAVKHGGQFADEYKQFLAILSGMFNLMRNMYVQQGFKFEQTEDRRYQIKSFLYDFDAIFTLNQDTLLEQHYFSDFFLGQSGGRWQGWESPGVQDMGEQIGNNPFYHSTTMKRVGDRDFSLAPQYQPYFKLHGSHNWTTPSGTLLITGGNKETDIGASPILNWYFQKFQEMVCAPHARLMIVGYGFGDPHINKVLLRAAEAKAKFFIVDIAGIDVLDKRNSTDLTAQKLWDVLGPQIIGGSRRLLTSTFGNDYIEHAKLQNFFK